MKTPQSTCGVSYSNPRQPESADATLRRKIAYALICFNLAAIRLSISSTSGISADVGIV